MRKAIIAVALAALILVPVGCGTGAWKSGRGAGIAWTWNDLDRGGQLARREGKKIFLYFGAGY